MSLSVESLQDEVMSFLRVREALCEAPLSGVSLSHLLAAFDSVWRQAVDENQVDSADNRQTICELTADAVIDLANAGIKPEDIKRYALAHVLFTTLPRCDSLH